MQIGCNSPVLVADLYATRRANRKVKLDILPEAI
jgi:hypothetical protein